MTEVNVAPTEIHVALPLPVDVASTLGLALDVLYPGARVRTDTAGHMTFVVDHDSRCRTKTSAAKIRAAKSYLESETEAVVRSFEKDGSMRLEAPSHVARGMVAALRAVFEDNPAAENHMVWGLSDEAGGKYEVTAVRPGGKTPAAMLVECRAELARVTAERDEARRQRDEARAVAA